LVKNDATLNVAGYDALYPPKFLVNSYHEDTSVTASGPCAKGATTAPAAFAVTPAGSGAGRRRSLM
jgi:hypothetical protein